MNSRIIKWINKASFICLALIGFSGPSQAVNIATDGIGEVAIIPYYTVHNGWQTLFSITNTNQDHAVVLKVRFREGKNSRDVLDFTVILPPNDMFSGFTGLNEDGHPAFFISDDYDDSGTITCVLPAAIGAVRQVLFGPAGFKDDSTAEGNADDRGYLPIDGFGSSIEERQAEGYIEIISMGSTPLLNAALNEVDSILNPLLTLLGLPAINSVQNVNVLRTAIRNADCGTLDEAFSLTSIVDTARLFGEPINAIKTDFRLLNSSLGYEAAGQATTLANFFNPGGFWPDREPDLTDGQITWLDNLTCVVSRGMERIDIDYDNERDGLLGDVVDIVNGVSTLIPGIEVGTTRDWVPGMPPLIDFPNDLANFDVTSYLAGVLARLAVLDIPGLLDIGVNLSPILKSCQNLITPQDPNPNGLLAPLTDRIAFSSLEPSLNDAFPQIASLWHDNQNRPLSLYPRMVGANAAREPGPTLFDPPLPPTSVTTGMPISGGLVQVDAEKVRGIDAVSLALNADSLINEWSNRAPGYGPKTGGVFDVKTTWVVNFPTKSFYTDQGQNRFHAIVDPSGLPDDRLEAGLWNFVPQTGNSGSVLDINYDAFGFGQLASAGYPPFGQRFKSSGCEGDRGVFLEYRAYDRAEQSDPTIISPGWVPLNYPLCYEVNLITFVNSDVTALDGVPERSAIPGQSILNVPIDVGLLQNNTALPEERQNDQGWLQLHLAGNTYDYPARFIPAMVDYGNYSTASYNEAYRVPGLPAIGFSLRTRSIQSSAFRNTAAIIPHGRTHHILE